MTLHLQPPPRSPSLSPKEGGLKQQSNQLTQLYSCCLTMKLAEGRVPSQLHAGYLLRRMRIEGFISRIRVHPFEEGGQGTPERRGISKQSWLYTRAL